MHCSVFFLNCFACMVRSLVGSPVQITVALPTELQGQMGAGCGKGSLASFFPLFLYERNSIISLVQK